MEADLYIEEIEKRLSPYYDIEKNYSYKGFQYDLFARSHVRNERYVASKKMTIYAFENNEYCLIKYFNHCTSEDISIFTENLKKAALDFVNPKEDHMSTVITGVIVLDDDLNEDLVKKIKEFKFTKSFAFGFKGWLYIRLIAVQLTDEKMISNRRGKEAIKFYVPRSS